MLGRWDKRLIDHRLMLQVLMFFQNFFQNSLQKLFQFIVLSFYDFTQIKISSFECLKSIRNYEKNDAWNIRRLVNEPIVPLAQRASVLY